MFTAEGILDHVLGIIRQLAGDWEYDGEITPETRLFDDLGYASLELVVLGAAIQERYGRLPFAEFLTQIGLAGKKEVTIADLAAFVGNSQGTSGARRI